MTAELCCGWMGPPTINKPDHSPGLLRLPGSSVLGHFLYLPCAGSVHGEGIWSRFASVPAPPVPQWSGRPGAFCLHAEVPRPPRGSVSATPSLLPLPWRELIGVLETVVLSEGGFIRAGGI